MCGWGTAPSGCSTHGGQKRAMKPLELESQKVVNRGARWSEKLTVLLTAVDSNRDLLRGGRWPFKICTSLGEVSKDLFFFLSVCKHVYMWVPAEARRWRKIPPEKELQASVSHLMWWLGCEFQSSDRAVSTFSHWAVSLAWDLCELTTLLGWLNAYDGCESYAT